jgi:hypothetical protein
MPVSTRIQMRRSAAVRVLGKAVVLLLALLALNGVPQRLVVIGPSQQVMTRNLKIGVHTRLTDEVEEWKIQRTFEMVREMGSPWAVEYFPWGYYEPEKGRYQWGHPDVVVAHAVAQGISLIARIDFVPEWARPRDTTARYLDREHYADYADFVATFARRYGDRVHYIVVWNEPNLSFEWGYRAPDAEGYTNLLCATYTAVKAARPEMHVLAAGLAPTLEPEGSELGLNDLTFLQRMYDHGAAACFDGLALHTYGLTSPPDDPPDPRALNFRRAELLRAIMVERGDAHKPCYITEGGWNDHPRWTKAVRSYQRLEYTIAAYEWALREWDWCQAVAMWVFRYPWEQRTYQDHYSFVTPGFIPKPIYSEVANYAHGLPYDYLEPER